MSFGICVAAPALSKYEYTFYKKLGYVDYWREVDVKYWIFVERFRENLFIISKRFIVNYNEMIYYIFGYFIIKLHKNKLSYIKKPIFIKVKLIKLDTKTLLKNNFFDSFFIKI